MKPLIKKLYAKTGPYLRVFQRFRAQFRVYFRAHRSFGGGISTDFQGLQGFPNQYDNLDFRAFGDNY
jgi:hypothetical protein